MFVANPGTYENKWEVSQDSYDEMNQENGFDLVMRMQNKGIDRGGGKRKGRARNGPIGGKAYNYHVTPEIYDFDYDASAM